MTGAALAGVRRPESVLVLVATRGGEVLLLERANPPGWWQSVTGSLERSESADDAAVRELREETGIRAGEQVENLKSGARFTILPEWRHRYAPGVNKNREHWFRLWLPRRCAIRLDPREHLRYEWIGAEQAAARVFSWSNRAAIERFILAGNEGVQVPGSAS